MAEPPVPHPEPNPTESGSLPPVSTAGPAHFNRLAQICELTRSAIPRFGPASRITMVFPACASLAAIKLPAAPEPTTTASTLFVGIANHHFFGGRIWAI